jgi:hypothetical protein
LKTGLVALTLAKYVSNLLNILLHESERGGAGARGSTCVLSVVTHLIFFASSEAEMKDVIWGFWFNKTEGLCGCHIAFGDVASGSGVKNERGGGGL